MEQYILKYFAEYLEKQEILSRMTEARLLHGYNYSEIHTIAAIKDCDCPNVTGIANYLNLTRGAVSKITKRLMTAGLIESYMMPNNQQKIYFRLTSIGEELYKEHDKRHQKWLTRDAQFLGRYNQQEQNMIENFMRNFVGYLDDQIKELGG